jgi:hypothetical protein
MEVRLIQTYTPCGGATPTVAKKVKQPSMAVATSGCGHAVYYRHRSRRSRGAWPRASMEFCGLEKEMQEKLIGEPPIQTIILEQAVAKNNHVIVGRLTYRLHCSIQETMVSRDHLKFTNNTPMKTCERVISGLVGNGDIITFGGAKSTDVGAIPGTKAIKSIYRYTFDSGV